MGVKVELLPKRLLEAARHHGWTDVEIASMSPECVFREYYEWHGLKNWAEDLVSALDAARRATNG